MLGSIVSGTLGAAGSLIGGALGYKSQKKANKTNKKLAREQMKFQTEANQKQMDFAERMANTAHQRQVEDLKKAGLNPILAAGGTGASAPQGSTSAGASAVMQAEDGLAQAVMNAAPQALTAMQQKANIDLTNAQKDNVNAQTVKTEQDTNFDADLHPFNVSKAETDLQLTKTQIRKLEVDTQQVQKISKLTDEQIKANKLSNEKADTIQTVWKEWPHVWALAESGQINLESIVTKAAGITITAGALSALGGPALLTRFGLGWLSRTKAGAELVKFLKNKPEMFKIKRTTKNRNPRSR